MYSVRHYDQQWGNTVINERVTLAKLDGAWTLGSMSCVDHYGHRPCFLCEEGHARIEAPSSVTVSEAHA